MPQATRTAGQLFVISAPSGAGKTTLVHKLMAANPDLRFSISYTTRKQRHTENHGEDYFFVQEGDFLAMIEANAFLEHAQVFDNRYGTARDQVQTQLDAGHNVILEIDWQGAQQVRRNMPECTTVFILPPSVPTLRERLTARGTDSEAIIDRRFRDAVSDMSHWDEFDYAVINDDLEQAAAELAAIVHNDEAAAGNNTRGSELQSRIRAIMAERR